jgi:hypothetical protein
MQLGYLVPKKIQVSQKCLSHLLTLCTELSYHSFFIQRK